MGFTRKNFHAKVSGFAYKCFFLHVLIYTASHTNVLSSLTNVSSYNYVLHDRLCYPSPFILL